MSVRGILCGAVAVVCSVASATVLAQSVQVRRIDCEQGVHLVAQNARASDVLRQLSRSAQFGLTIEDPIDSVVNIDAVRPTQRLLTDLLGAESVIITERSDPRCPGRYRVDHVWVLRKGAAPSATAAARPPIPFITPEAREQDELYQRGHGMLPP